ncbi:class I SAM-dependent methyltransferase [Sinorhizobium meliloti]|uniref:class I SAM-dependent methyltransferase n=1 Tax=Rhizobium meliloti TaxID=382 RepID=UPI0013E34A2F|nr:class I SAM-dependent methyltransferase [Sinorhizobium meliloti]
MLNKIGTAGYESLSRPQYTTIDSIKKLLESGIEPVIAEIGVGIGATSRGICEVLNGRGKLHVFDFQAQVDVLADDLRALGYTNVIPHGNTHKHWDSYHWSLMKLWQAVRAPVFDYVYLDGAHTLLHDTAAFFIADKLLKIGGTIDFDDYAWSYAPSKAMVAVRHEYMTKEQEEAAQVKMIVDAFVKGSTRYETVIENKAYRKLADA